MKLLYGTGNAAKLRAMRSRLHELDIELLSLQEMESAAPAVEEDGNTPLENAEKKARAYFRAFGIPVFSCDSGLYIQELPEKRQPAVHVRRVGGKELTDEEMIAYYASLAKQYGRLTAHYENAICLVLAAACYQCVCLESAADLLRHFADYFNTVCHMHFLLILWEI